MPADAVCGVPLCGAYEPDMAREATVDTATLLPPSVIRDSSAPGTPNGGNSYSARGGGLLSPGPPPEDPVGSRLRGELYGLNELCELNELYALGRVDPHGWEGQNPVPNA